MSKRFLGLKEALDLTLMHLKPLGVEVVALGDSMGRVAVSDLFARVDSPSVDASRKDGFAVLSGEVARAMPENPVQLRLVGSMAAGCEQDIPVRPGMAVRVLTGAPVPSGADAVVAEEFVMQKGNDIFVGIIAEPGRNILPRGGDVSSGQCVLRQGQKITPGVAGLLAAAGHSIVTVVRKPVVGIIGIGDEIVEPCRPITRGKLYASNVVTVAGWCHTYEMETRTIIVRDDHDAISGAIENLSGETDVVITNGGAWTGDHDMVARVLEMLGWKEIFHHVRIGPGKPVGFGILNEKPIFVLSGGPASNMTGFLQVVLPGLHTLSGHVNPGLPQIMAKLASPLKGREPDWTDFFYGAIVPSDYTIPTFYPSKEKSALIAMAGATAVASIPEGRDYLPENTIIRVHLLK